MHFGSFRVERIVLLARVVLVAPLHLQVAAALETRTAMAFLVPDELLFDAFLDGFVVVVFSTGNEAGRIDSSLGASASCWRRRSKASRSSLRRFSASRTSSRLNSWWRRVCWRCLIWKIERENTLHTSNSFFRFSSSSFRSFSRCALVRNVTFRTSGVYSVHRNESRYGLGDRCIWCRRFLLHHGSDFLQNGVHFRLAVLFLCHLRNLGHPSSKLQGSRE